MNLLFFLGLALLASTISFAVAILSATDEESLFPGPPSPSQGRGAGGEGHSPTELT